jgi:porin
MANQALWRVNPKEGKGLDATVGCDWSPAAINRNNMQLTAGLRFNEPIPLHIHNTIALGYVQNSLSSLFLPPDASAWKAERAIECNVRLDVAPMLTLHRWCSTTQMSPEVRSVP